MAKVVVLGGCGAVGSVAARTLAEKDDFSEVVIGDINIERAKELAGEIDPEKVSAVKLDASDAYSVKDAIAGSDIVLNCTGPFYLFVKTILNAVIESGINYVDVCDDVDVTGDILEMDAAAKEAGISALIGMGSSPGVTNLIGKLAADVLLEEVDAIDIYHAHGGEPIEGPGVIGHRFHCMTIDCPQFLDGELKTVRFFEPDGVALQEEVDFHLLGEGIRVYPYPHPEQVTMPRYIKANRVTNKGTVLPEEYYNLIKDMCRLGLNSKEPVDVKGQQVVPYDFSMAYIIRERDRILEETSFGTQRGCVKIVASGKKDGKPHKYVFSMASEGEALGEGTGIPAAMGVTLMQRGKVSQKGVFPPEGGVNPMEFVGLMGEFIKPGGDDKKFEKLIVESIDHEGNVKHIDI